MAKKLSNEEITKKYAEMVIATQEAEKQIVSNYDYISWLENFTQTYATFSTDSWLYTKKEISEENYDNVQKLFLFFNAISNYCRRFYINIEWYEAFERERINIKHNNVGYQLGLVVGQGSFVYVSCEEPQDNAICFDSIMNNVVPAEFKAKDELLQQFNSLLATMKEADMPSGIITDTLKKYYNH